MKERLARGEGGVVVVEGPVLGGEGRGEEEKDGSVPMHTRRNRRMRLR